MSKRTTLKKSNKNTFAVVARIYVGELPYVNAWLNYYTQLGIDKIYLIITNPAESKKIKDYLHNHPAHQKIVFYVSKIQTIKMTAYDSVVPIIKEDYTLFLDIDEYLDISTYGSFNALLKHEPGEKHHFYWLISTHDGLSNPAKGFHNKFAKRPFKTMCKTSIISGWKNSHDFLTKVPVTPVFSKCSVVHLFGRSFNDMLIKCFYGAGYGNEEKTASEKDLETAIHSTDVNAIPSRLKMMALISRVRKSVVLNRKVLKHLDYDYALETALLDSMLEPHQISHIYTKYTKFRDAMDYNTQVKQYFVRGLGGIDFEDLKVAINV
jgi:hypothetical protein